MGFEDLDDLSELDEIPPFEEDLDVPGFDDSGDGGVSRTFKILGAVLVLAVVGIVILLVVFALGDGDELTDNDKTSTAAIRTNTAVSEDLGRTQTAVQVAILASQEFVQTLEANATQTQHAVETSEAQEATEAAQAATDAAQTAAANALLTQTAEAQAAATEEALNLTMTAVAVENTLTGRLVDRENTPASGVVIRLYRDDGDGQFDPGDVGIVPVEPGGAESEPTPFSLDPEEFSEPAEGANGEGAGQPTAPAEDAAPTDGEAPAADEAPANEEPSASGTALAYGDTVSGALFADEATRYTFTGSQDDVLVITIEPEAEADMIARLIGPDGSTVAEGASQPDDRSVIVTTVLPAEGEYTLEVQALAETEYTLVLDGASSMTDGGETSYVPRGAGVPLGPVDVLVRQDGTATPEPDGDQFVGQVTTGDLGNFDFGQLEPGIYFLVIAYDDLPPSLQALVSPDREFVSIMVNVPVSGEVTFTVGAEPTATPDPIFFDQTATALALLTPTEGTPEEADAGTPDGTITVTITPTLEMPDTGIFSDSGGSVDSSDGLSILAIAAIGLMAVVFVARKLRTSA